MRIPKQTFYLLFALALVLPLLVLSCGDDDPTGDEVVVTCSPSTVSVNLGATQQFTATVTGNSNTAVTWAVVGGATFGAITTTGLYTAPVVLPSPVTATVRATSVADASKSASATVTLTDNFIFATDAPSAYTRIDRMGMPAIATAVISLSNKDEYNADDPEDDATLKWAADITTNVTALHTALDDDLAGVPLTPCVPGDCVTRAAPFVIPDDLSIDTASPAGFPNGRRLTDQVIDLTLALLLLDESHALDTFANLPLNPAANDAVFLPDFPYLAAPN